MRLHLEASALHLGTNATSVSGLDIGKKCVGVRQNSLINDPSTDMDQGLEIRVDIDSEVKHILAILPGVTYTPPATLKI